MTIIDTTTTASLVQIAPTYGPCPAWCAPGECNTYDTERAHHSTTEQWSADEARFELSLSRIDDAGAPAGHSLARLYLDVAPAYPGLGFSLSTDEALYLAAWLIEFVNETLPESEQSFIGPPGFEFIPHGDGYGLNGL